MKKREENGGGGGRFGGPEKQILTRLSKKRRRSIKHKFSLTGRRLKKLHCKGKKRKRVRGISWGNGRVYNKIWLKSLFSVNCKTKGR